MQKKHLSRIALSGLLALSMVPSASMQIYADNKTAEESTWGGKEQVIGKQMFTSM